MYIVEAVAYLHPMSKWADAQPGQARERIVHISIQYSMCHTSVPARKALFCK